jgi:HK97 family phage portal protein
MELFGWTILRTKQAPLRPLDARNAWWPVVRESYTGAWQSNVEVRLVDVLAHPTVFACITLIASDIAKCRLRLVELDANNGIWKETDSPAFSPVLRKPNRYQTRISFIKSWLISKLAYGNTYVLKQRDNRGVVVALYVLDPTRVTPLVTDDGGVYYELKRDDLSQLRADRIVVPASEIVHDIMHPLYHPLVGLSPLYASGVAAVLGLRIEHNSTKFFENMSAPSGMLTAPGAIGTDTATRLKETFETKFSGENIGRLIVGGDGLKFDPFTMTAVDSQLSQQWTDSSKAICSTYKVPGYKVGVEAPPSYNNIEALDRQYYSQCLQEHFESIELLLDEGMGLAARIDGRQLGTEFDLDDLLRLDSATLMGTLTQGTGAGIMAINEARKRVNLPPAKGGEEPILQQQNWPLSQIAERPMPTRETPAPDPDDVDEDDDAYELDDEMRDASFDRLLRKELELHA